MRILFFAHPAFFKESPAEIQEWLRLFGTELSKLGHEVVFFHPESTKVRDFDVVHVFSREEAETWNSLQSYGAKILVTPELLSPNRHKSARKALPKRLMPALLRAGRAVLQRRWPPVDPEFFLSIAPRYLVTTRTWAARLEKEWKVPRDRIHFLPPEPEDAAKIAESQYLALLGAQAPPKAAK